MNQSEKCHRIQGCKRLYIDAFRAFKSLTEVEGNTFILTHYHADHWAGLPRGKSYIGPCKIHCTPVTGNLLREIHKLDDSLIVEHAYGSTWNDCDGNNITFYDANHCPGAAIVFVATKGGRKHLHTGDMRYHDEKFRSYPLLSEAIQNRELDILYLDTTYAKPKHCFAPQHEAIEIIASQVGELLNSNEDIVSKKKQSFFKPKVKADMEELASTPVRTLVLLSCYSIGKEKVLWNSALKSNQFVFVNKTKHRMLQCIKAHQDIEASSGIIDRCTLDPKKSDIHVITMGTAGSLHPFFQPNFEECALYAHRLNKGYNKVVAFLPTGWANSSKYNKENGIAKKIVDLKEIVKKGKVNGNNHMMDVEVRCVAYSEHSSYNELRACVEYTRPKQIIPTVFSGEKDYAAIEKRFQDLVDSQRAKQAFISKISGIGVKRKAAVVMKNPIKQKISRPQYTTKVSKCQMPRIMPYKNNKSKSQDEEDEVPHQKLNAFAVSVTKVHRESLVEKSGISKQLARHKAVADDAKVAMMVSMGFNPSSSSESLIAKSNNLEEAIEWLLSR